MKNNTKNIRKGITAILFVVMMVVSVLAVVPVVSATVTVYPDDRPGWESAVCVYEEEFFTDATLNPGVSVVTDLGYVDTGKGVWWDRLVCPADGLTTTTWQFATPLDGFGGNWDPGVPGGPGARIAVAIDGSWVSVGEIPETYTGQFWGFVSTEPFSAVRLSPGSNCDGAWCETYELDNMVYSFSNQPPVADAGPDQTVEQTKYQGADVTLDGSGSADDGQLQPLAYTWAWADGSATGVNPTVQLPLGTTTVTLTVYDGQYSATDTVVVIVVDTTPPAITCPADVTVEQETADGTVVPLTATAADICDADPTITSDELAIYPLGTTTVTFTATDDSGNSATCTTAVTVIDTTPPDISVTVIPDTLWPPNHKMVDIVATVTVSDICDAAPSVVLTSVTSNEPDNDQGKPYDPQDSTSGDGNTVDDIQGAETGEEDYEFQLRAERAGAGDGRVYTITYTVTDASGNSASASATVVVPHDMR